MTREKSVLLVDDDPIILKLMSMRFKRRFPDFSIDIHEQPDSSGEYDIYILDNDFHGRALAGELAEQIKSRHPNSLVIAFSSALDTAALKKLINCGCSGAFDKSRPEEMERMMQLIERHVSAAPATKNARHGSTLRVLDTARAISQLIHSWNRRLDIEERREQADAAHAPSSASSAGTESAADARG